MAVAQQQHVVVDIEGAVAWIKFNRPDKRNAIGTQARTELAAALKQVEKDPAVRCVVLTGEGTAFSSGADLRDFPSDIGNAVEHVGHILRDDYMPMILRMRQMPKPIIAAVNGVAAGIGMSFAMAADIRIAAEDADFRELFVGIGLIPDGGATWFLPRLVGTGKALEMCMTGQPLAARDAERLGLVNQVVPGDQLEATVRELAGRLAAGPPLAIAGAKRAINRALDSSLEDAMEYESYLQETMAGSADFVEGVTAFLEKRPPRFSGQ
jgi:2-(1,2-epoxy-1,2-dihydrophenyl)acetyl-CoA isomerase